MMHDRGKSDSAVVAVKPTNNAGQPAAEPHLEAARAAMAPPPVVMPVVTIPPPDPSAYDVLFGVIPGASP
jgi:hypothetical protein